MDRNFSSGGYRNDRRVLFFSAVGQRKKKHDKRKKLLGSKIFVVDPVPLFPVGHGDEGIVGLLRRAVNPYEWWNRNSVRHFRSGSLIGSLFLYVGGRNVNVRGKVGQDFEHGTGQDRDLLV